MVVLPSTVITRRDEYRENCAPMTRLAEGLREWQVHAHQGSGKRARRERHGKYQRAPE